LFAVLAPSVLSWVAYRGVRSALESEFERRLENVAAATAAQISADDIADAGRLGEESAGWGNLQVQLEELRATTSLTNASLFDSARSVVYDCRGPEHLHEITRLDTLAGLSVREALTGHPVVSPMFTLIGHPHRAGLAPVLGARGSVAGVVAVEAPMDYLPELVGFGRTLFLTWLLLTAAIGVFALLRIRQTLATERLERRLARSEMLAAMGRLTATLAHEIKNPLAIIRGSAERLGKLEPEARRMADFVIEESDRLSRTVARYLQFAKGTDAPRDSGDAVAALETTLDLLEGEALARRVEIAREGTWEATPVPLDNEAMKQIYLNVLLNAMEAMPEGGRISVACRTVGSRVEIEIADRGPGVPEDQMTMLGTPFHTTKSQGSGLGFFLSRRLAQSAGGDLRLSNVPEGGAVCVLTLPRKPR
jgi:signal transduction histidine kinase